MTDATPGERVALPCPACSPDLETVHEVLKPGGQVTVRCTECDHVHKTQLPEASEIQRKVVVSQEGESFSTQVDVPAEEELATGEEFLLETEEAIMTVRITSLELDGEQRVDEATAEDVRTIWTRAVGNVSVNVTMHPEGRPPRRDGELQAPHPRRRGVHRRPGSEYGDNEFTVEGFHVRDDAHGYDRDRYDQGGDSVVAKDVKRLYVRDESTTAWSAW